MTTDDAVDTENLHEPVRSGRSFRVEPSAIPAGIRCLQCGKLHMPAMVIDTRIPPAPDARILRCPRCETTTILRVDSAHPDDRDLTALLRETPTRSDLGTRPVGR